MATQAQIDANRRNAQKSTGPQTQQGKTAVSKNAVKHGLLTRYDVIRAESQADFDLHREKILKELAPADHMESMLAERIVSLSWRLNRTVQIQNQTIDALNADNTPGPLAKMAQSILPKGLEPQTNPDKSAPELALGRLAVKDLSNARVLERLLMYERRIEHSLFKTVTELQRLNLIKNLNTDRKMTIARLTRRKS